MAKTLSFSVEDAKLVKENPESNFAVLSFDFFASGENLHDLWVSEATLMRTADTIKNCPVVWKYDESLDDVYTHDDEEVPCGFIPETSQIKSRKMSDGRTMLSVIAYVWKRYTGELLNIFKRDGGTKPVSVEMTVFDMKELPNGKIELSDFKYDGITVLGSFVTPAIRGAQATVLSFADIANEYQEAYEKEFSAHTVTDLIPQIVKDNAETGLKLRKQHGKGGTSTAIASAHYLMNNTNITPEKAKLFSEYFSRHKSDSLLRAEPPSDSQISWLLWGGTEGWKWVETLTSELEQIELDKIEYGKENNILTFPYKSKSEMNPALKGIHPPVSLAQANSIARQAEAIGQDEKKNGWAIAIANFKKTHKVVNGRWVKKESKESMATELGKEKELKVDKSKEMSATTSAQDAQETYLEADSSRKEEQDMANKKQEQMTDKPEEQMQEEQMQEEQMQEEQMQETQMQEEEKQEDKMEHMEDEEDKEPDDSEEEEKSEGEDKMAEEATFDNKKEDTKENNMDMPDEVKAAMSVDTILSFMESEAPLYQNMNDDYGKNIIKIFKAFASEVAKGKYAIAKNLTSLMVSFMSEATAKISDQNLQLAEANEEIAKLRNFKESTLAEKFAFEVDSVLSEAFDAGMPRESIDKLREDSKEFTLESIDVYKNMVKAHAFVYVNNSDKRGDGTGEEVIKIGLPFADEKPKTETLWE